MYLFPFLQALTKMQKDWEIVHFTFTQYKDTDLSILAAPDDVQVLIDDHVVKTATMRGSPFIGPIETEVKEWELRLVSEEFSDDFEVPAS